jgi:hypothetical protein
LPVFIPLPSRGGLCPATPRYIIAHPKPLPFHGRGCHVNTKVKGNIKNKIKSNVNIKNNVNTAFDFDLALDFD